MDNRKNTSFDVRSCGLGDHIAELVPGVTDPKTTDRKKSIQRVASAQVVADRYMQKLVTSRTKTAGEVRFIKDKSGDERHWAYADNDPSEREITPDYAFTPKNVKPLAETLRSVSASLGHLMSGYQKFAKLKSANVSPDGRLGGKGYIQSIATMRKKFMNTIEALSSLSDTLYDEVRAPHWAAISRADPEDEEEIAQILDHTDQIRKDPEAWSKEELKEDQEQRVK